MRKGCNRKQPRGSYVRLADHARRQHCPEDVLICIAEAALLHGKTEEARSIIMRIDGPAGDELVRAYEIINLAAEAAARTTAQKMSIAAIVEKAAAKAVREKRHPRRRRKR